MRSHTRMLPCEQSRRLSQEEVLRVVDRERLVCAWPAQLGHSVGRRSLHLRGFGAQERAGASVS